MAYQTFIVLVLSVMSFALGLIAANETALGITAPWLNLVVIPTLMSAITLAANQLKSIGSPAPNTITETKTTSIVPPPAPPAP